MKMTEYKTTVLSLSQMMVDRLIEQLLSLDELSGTVLYITDLLSVSSLLTPAVHVHVHCHVFIMERGKKFCIALKKFSNFLQILINQILHVITCSSQL